MARLWTQSVLNLPMTSIGDPSGQKFSFRCFTLPHRRARDHKRRQHTVIKIANQFWINSGVLPTYLIVLFRHHRLPPFYNLRKTTKNAGSRSLRFREINSKKRQLISLTSDFLETTGRKGETSKDWRIPQLKSCPCCAKIPSMVRLTRKQIAITFTFQIPFSH